MLAPNQLGVGVRGGAEAIAHAVSEAVKEDPGRWVLQADLVNAFNVVDRGVVLEQVAREGQNMAHLGHFNGKCAKMHYFDLP